MTHGAPDWSKYRPDSRSYGLSDLAELAARLGSISTFDRRGDIIWQDAFAHGLQHWDPINSGTGAAVVISPISFLSHGYAILVTTRSDSPFNAGIQNLLPYTPHGSIGIEVAFTLSTAMGLFTLDLLVYDGINLTRGALRYNRVTDLVSYKVNDATWTNLTPAVKTGTDDRLFHHMKLVLNPGTDEYIRALLNNQEFSLANIPTYAVASGTTPRIYIQATFTAASATNATGYLDNIIVTESEP